MNQDSRLTESHPKALTEQHHWPLNPQFNHLIPAFQLVDATKDERACIPAVTVPIQDLS